MKKDVHCTEGLRGETRFAELCCREGLRANLKLSKEIYEVRKQRLAGDLRHEVNEMRNGIEMLKKLATELSIKNVPLKKLAGLGRNMGELVPLNMRHSQVEKREIIHLIMEHSVLKKH